jgi:hypothetical protein
LASENNELLASLASVLKNLFTPLQCIAVGKIAVNNQQFCIWVRVVAVHDFFSSCHHEFDVQVHLVKELLGRVLILVGVYVAVF